MCVEFFQDSKTIKLTHPTDGGEVILQRVAKSLYHSQSERTVLLATASGYVKKVSKKGTRGSKR